MFQIKLNFAIFKLKRPMAFRSTLVCLKRLSPSPSAPSQVLLRLVEKMGSPTTEELWREASQSADSSFNSKNHMKKVRNSIPISLF
jgi:hypothetical protein